MDGEKRSLRPLFCPLSLSFLPPLLTSSGTLHDTWRDPEIEHSLGPHRASKAQCAGLPAAAGGGKSGQGAVAQLKPEPGAFPAQAGLSQAPRARRGDPGRRLAMPRPATVQRRRIKETTAGSSWRANK